MVLGGVGGWGDLEPEPLSCSGTSRNCLNLLKRSVCPFTSGSRKNLFLLDDQSFEGGGGKGIRKGRDCWGLPHPVQTSELLTLCVFPCVFGNCASSVGGHQILSTNVIVSQPRGCVGELKYCCVVGSVMVYLYSQKSRACWSIHCFLRCLILWTSVSVKDFRDTCLWGYLSVTLCLSRDGIFCTV